MMRNPVLLVLAVLLVGAGAGAWASLEPLRHRYVSPRVNMETRKQYYRSRLSKEGGCIPITPPPNPPPLPEVPKSFITEIEMASSLPDDQYIMYGMEMYDSSSLRGVNKYQLAEGIVLTRPYMLAETMHYSLLKDEALFILSNEDCSITGQEDCTRFKFCTAGVITDMSVELQEIFGIIDMSGGSEFLGAMGLLAFGPQFNYTAKSLAETCRGVDCDVFETCLYKPEEDATLIYTYYWSTVDWKMQNNGDQVPIAVDIFGSGKFGGHLTREIQMRIDFFDFKREWMPSRNELEPPVDVYCYGRKSIKLPPKAVSMFSYKSELVTGFNVFVSDGDNQTTPLHFRGMYAQKEWYDYEMKVTRHDYLPFFIYGTDKRFENLTQEIHDFNQGISYKLRPRQNFCKISYIENITSWGDVIVGEDGSVNMLSPWNMEDLNEPMQYNGLHWERGMQADVWVGIKENHVLKLNETIVWYFASPFTNEIMGTKKEFPGIQTIDKVPIKLEKYLTVAEGLPHTIYNIYGYDSKRPTTHTHDISSCYDSSQMRHFQFDLPPDSLNKSMYLMENLKYAIQEALMEAGTVSPLRINRLEIHDAAAALQVVYTLLEKPSVVGDVIGDQFESTMDEAVNKIYTSIDTSQLVIVVKMGNNVLEPDAGRRSVTIATLVALPRTMMEISRDDGLVRGDIQRTGYSSGDMTGLAFGMLALGGILGYVVLYFYPKK